MNKTLKHGLMMGAIGLTAMGGLVGCDDPNAPSNPANFPSQGHMVGVVEKWYPIVAGNYLAGGANFSCTQPSAVRWGGDRWSMDMNCMAFHPRSKGLETVTAHADFVKDWITGSQYQR